MSIQQISMIPTSIPVQLQRTDDHLLLVASHAYWKEKLCDAITNEGLLDAKDVFQGNSCGLTRWLCSEEGHPHISHLQSYHYLKIKNAEFHAQASKVAEYINTRKYGVALRLIEFNSAFEYASTAVILAIFYLKKEAKETTKLG